MDSFPSAALTRWNPGLSDHSIFKLLFREENPAGSEQLPLPEMKLLEVNSAVLSMEEHVRVWPGMLAGS